MKTYLRFADLRERGIVNSWPMLRLRVERDGFPCGVKAGPNTRIWERARSWPGSLRARPTRSPLPAVAGPPAAKPARRHRLIARTRPS